MFCTWSLEPLLFSKSVGSKVVQMNHYSKMFTNIWDTNLTVILPNSLQV